ncbi:hypothetical protein FRC01_012490 [Tulasnella sp. 417]|nr:hypothetical protein FRC01_012490 [Tulasnella sp. 417]
MFSKLFSALPFSSTKPVPQQPPKTNRGSSKVPGLGKRIKKIFTRPHSKEKKTLRIKGTISSPVAFLQASTRVVPLDFQVEAEDPLAFENPRSPPHPPRAIWMNTLETPGLTPGQRQSQQSSVDHDPSQWLATPRDSPDRSSWNWEYGARLAETRYSAAKEDLVKAEEEATTVTWDGLFSGSPEDCRREGKRAQARGLKSWADPLSEMVVVKEIPLPTSASDVVVSFRERERPRPRGPRARHL